jgi:hypothetical protein
MYVIGKEEATLKLGGGQAYNRSADWLQFHKSRHNLLHRPASCINSAETEGAQTAQ